MILSWLATNEELRQRVAQLTRDVKTLKEERDQALIGKENEAATYRAEATRLNTTIINLKSEVHDLTETLMTLCVQAHKIVIGGNTEPSAWRGDWMWDRIKLPARDVIHQQIIGRLRVLQNGENDQKSHVKQLGDDIKNLKHRLEEAEKHISSVEEERDHYRREATRAYGHLGVALEAQNIGQLTADYLRSQLAKLSPEFKSLKAEKAASAVKAAVKEAPPIPSEEVPVPPSITPPKGLSKEREHWARKTNRGA